MLSGQTDRSVIRGHMVSVKGSILKVCPAVPRNHAPEVLIHPHGFQEEDKHLQYIL